MVGAGRQGARRHAFGIASSPLLCSASLVAVLAAGIPLSANAAVRYWDSNGTDVGTGGGGTWNLSNLNWSPSGDGVSGPYVSPWNNSAFDDAIFAGTAGTVTLGAGITAHNLTFSTTGYVLTGGTLTLGGITPTIFTATGTTEIHSAIAGASGLTKSGGGALQLYGANTFSGGVSLLSGTLYAETDAGLGAASNNITTAAGANVTLRIDGTGTARSVTIGDGGTLTLAGAGVGSARITGNGSVRVSPSNQAATIVSLTNDASDYTGATIFSGCNNVCTAYFSSIADLGVASSLGAPTTVADGTIVFNQSSQYSDDIIYIGTGHSSNRNWDLNGDAANIRNEGTGTLTLTGDVDISVNGSFFATSADISLLGTLSGGSFVFNAANGQTITAGGVNTFTGNATIAGIGGSVKVATLTDGGNTSSLGAGTGIVVSNGTLSYTGTGSASNRSWTVNGAGSILNDGTGALDLSGALSFNAATPNPDSLTFGGSFSGVNSFSGVVSGTGNLVSVGAGSWVLGGANTFTGSVTVNSGTLRAGHASAFGNATGFTVNGGTLDLNGYALTTSSLGGTGGEIALGNGVLTVLAKAPQRYAGSITGTGGLTKSGAAPLTLTGISTYSGPTTINGGKLVLDFTEAGGPTQNIISASSSLTLSGGSIEVHGAAGETNSQTFNGLTVSAGSNTVRGVSGAGGTVNLSLGAVSRTGGLANFVLPGNGTITTTNADGALGGWATVNGSDYAKVVSGGIISFDATDYTTKDDAGTWLTGEIISDTGGLPDTAFHGTVTGTVALGGLRYTAAQNSTVTIGGGSSLGIDGTIIVAPSVGAGTQTITGGRLASGSGGGTLGVQQNGSGIFTIASEIADVTGTTLFAKGGAGTVVLFGSNSYTGSTTVADGTLRIQHLADGGVLSSIGASTADAANLVLEGGVLQYTGGTVTTDRGFTLVNGGPSRTIEITNSAAHLTFAGQITSPDDAGLTKAGPGALILAHAANDYVGATTINGGTLVITTLSDGGIASSIGAASSDAANIVLAGGTLAYAGGTTSTNREMTLGTGGGGINVTMGSTTLTVSGVLTGTSLTKSGAGTLVLSGANTYTNGNTVSQGILRAGAANVFSGSMQIDPGASLDLNNFDNSVARLNGGGNVSLGSGTLTVTSGGTFTGVISGSGGLTRAGTNQFVLNLNGCNNTYTGTTTITSATMLTVDCLTNGGQPSSIGASTNSSGSLVFSNGSLNYTGGSVTTDRGFTLSTGGGTIRVNDTATVLEFTGAIAGSTQLRKEGAGTLVLSGTHTGSGGTRIYNGTVRAGSTTAIGSGAFTLDNTAGVLLDLNGYDNDVAYIIGGGTTGGTIDLGGATLTINTGASLANATYAGIITGAGGLIKNGTASSHIQYLSSCASDYSGVTQITGGVLAINCLGNGGSASSIGSSSADASNLVLNGGTLQYRGAGGSTDRRFTLGSSTASTLDASGTGAIVFANTAGLTFSSPNANQTLNLGGTSNHDNVLAAQITDNGTGVTRLTKADAGTWILTNPNSTYTGITTVSGGVLGVGKLSDGGVASSIGASSAAASNLVIGNGSTLRYTGAGDTTNRLFTLSSGVTYIESSGTGAIEFTDSGPVTLQGNNLARTIALGGTNTGNNILAGSIGNAGSGVTSLVKNDSGTWILTGNHSYSGSTNINGGLLVIGNGGTSGSIASDTVNNFGTLGFNRTDTLFFGSEIVGAGAVLQSGTGVTVLTGTNLYRGGTTINAGTLQISANTNIGAASGNVTFNGGTLRTTATFSSNRTMMLTGAGAIFTDGGTNLDLGGVISGAGAFTKAGGGTLVLRADNSYGGATVLNDGTLRINGDQSAATGLTTVNNGATLGGSGIIGGSVLINNGGMLVPGNSPGTLAIKGDLILSGGSALDFEFGAAGVVGGPFNDLIDVGGNLVLDGTIHVTVPAGGIFDSGIYRVINYSGTLTDNGLDLGIMPTGSNITVQTSVAGQVNLINSAGLELSFWDGGVGPKFNHAVNGGAGVWRLGGTDNNWTDANGAMNAAYADSRLAIFSGVGDVVTVNNGNGAVSTPGMQFASDGYTISGDALTLAGSQSAIRVGDGSSASAGFTTLISAELTGAAQLVKVDAGTLILTGANSYTGGTAINAGVLKIATDANLGNASGGISFNGGTLHTTADITSGRDVTLVDAATILTDGGTTLTLNGLVLGGGSFTKAGAGTLVLTAENRYGGPTVVTEGSFFITGNNSAATGPTSVASGATLGGTGTIGGDVMLADGATLAPGAGAAGTLTINGDLGLSAGTQLAFEFGQANVAGGAFNDLVEVGGDLTLDGTINVSVPAGGVFGAGVYRVFNYGGTLTNNGLALGTLPVGSGVHVQTALAGQVNLVNSTGLMLNFWDGAAGPRNNGVVNGGDGTWQNSSGTDSWTDADGLVNADYADATFAIFAGTSGTVQVDNSLGDVRASGLQFAVDGYVIGGDALTLVGTQSIVRVGGGTSAGVDMTATIAAGLTGGTQLVKSDAGMLVLSGTNSYAGGTVVEGGTLAVSSDANLGDAAGGVTFSGGTLRAMADLASGRSISFTGNGTILTDAGTAVTLSGAFFGNGMLAKAGAGTLVLTGENGGYTGGGLVTAGALAVDGALGGIVEVASGGRLEGRGSVAGTVNNGVIAPGRGIGTLTVAGGYVGAGGTLEIEAVLGDDRSATDRLAIRSNTSGNTVVTVINREGLGGLTSEGIKIIDIAGASEGSFVLNGDYVFQGEQAVIAGAYGYRLYKNGVTDPQDGDWYLRSSLSNPKVEPEEPSGPPSNPPSNPPSSPPSSPPAAPTPAPQPLYQPGVPVYEGYTQTLQALNALSTLQQRVGNRSWANVRMPSDMGIWGRMEASRHRPETRHSTSGTDQNIDTWQMHMGLDAVLNQRDDGATLIGGVTVHYGKADASIASIFGTGKIDTHGYGLGATLTWYGPEGFYADGQAKFSWFDSDLKSGTLGALIKGHNGKGEAVSLELGKRSPIGRKLALTPQIQMTYAHVDFDRFVDPAGATVSASHSDSFKTRWGVAIDHQNSWERATDTRRSHVYALANLSYEWLDGTQVEVSGTPIESRNQRLWGQLGIGGSYGWGGGKYMLYTEVSGDTPIANFGDGYNLKGSVGFRARF